MEEETQTIAGTLVKPNYIAQGVESLKSRDNLLKSLLAQRCLPQQGWDDMSIRHVLSTLALMDSNNFRNMCGVGEREGRVYSNIVRERHFGFAHGIGRSGDINTVQPKAAGSSLLYQITNHLANDAIKIAGFVKVKESIVLPLATGMAISLVATGLLGNEGRKKKVLWCRCDQKSCLKALVESGFHVVVMEGVLVGDEVTTDLAAIQHHLESDGENIAAVFTTTSCFAPRAPDNVVEVAKLCAKFNVVHIVNNAYGVQATKTMATINQAHCQGRIDAIIQSTDKNFMVPVGGSIVCSGNKGVIARVSQVYPGRGSATPIVDLFITLLSMGKSGYSSLLKRRVDNLASFKEKLKALTPDLGERLLNTPHNPTSFCLSLSSFPASCDLTKLGSMLYSRHCTGARVVDCKGSSKVCGFEFPLYGANINEYPTPYLTMACAIGMETDEIDMFLGVLQTSLASFRKSLKASSKPKQEPVPQNE